MAACFVVGLDVGRYVPGRARNRVGSIADSILDPREIDAEVGRSLDHDRIRRRWIVYPFVGTAVCRITLDNNHESRFVRYDGCCRWRSPCVCPSVALRGSITRDLQTPSMMSQVGLTKPAFLHAKQTKTGIMITTFPSFRHKVDCTRWNTVSRRRVPD
jgi:hypothetical protein